MNSILGCKNLSETNNKKISRVCCLWLYRRKNKSFQCHATSRSRRVCVWNEQLSSRASSHKVLLNHRMLMTVSLTFRCHSLLITSTFLWLIEGINSCDGSFEGEDEISNLSFVLKPVENCLRTARSLNFTDLLIA